MKKLLICTLLVVLAGCCGTPDPEGFVSSFYSAVDEGNIDEALTYINVNELDISDERFDSLPAGAGIREYITEVIALKNNQERDINLLNCRGNGITWDEVICEGDDCTLNKVEFLLFDELIIMISAW